MLVQVRKIGGGFLEAFFDVKGLSESHVDRVFGKDEEELRLRLRIQFPNRRIVLKKVWL